MNDPFAERGIHTSLFAAILVTTLCFRIGGEAKPPRKRFEARALTTQADHDCADIEVPIRVSEAPRMQRKFEELVFPAFDDIERLFARRMRTLIIESPADARKFANAQCHKVTELSC